MRSRSLQMLAAGTTAVALLSACSSDDTSSTGSSATTSAATTAAAANASATPAADLRAGLTGLLTDHVWLAGTATGAALGNGADSEEFKAAAAELDANSVALSKAVGSAYPDAEEPFLKSWRQHIGFFVDYTVGAAKKDTAAKTKAKAALDGYRTDFGALINSVVPELPADAVANELTPHVSSLLAAIDAQAAKSTEAYALLSEAVTHMPMTAKTLAGGIDANKKLDGDPNSPASELRSGLTSLLDNHVWLAGNATGAALSAGPDSAAYKAAGDQLDANSVALSKAVGSAYPDAEDPFLKSWRQHITFFVNYTVGAAGKDTAAQDKAKADLEGYRTDFGALINSVVPELPANAVADELTPHVSSLLAAIDAQAAKDTKQYNLLYMAAMHMPDTAKTLAGGITTNKGLAG